MSADSPGNTEAIGVCYLCGEQLEDPINRDHIPPSLFFADSIRQRYNLSQLLTARVHQQCNTFYRMDEEYLAYTLMPYIRRSEAGLALYNQILSAYQRGRNVALIRRVLDEFDRRPSGLVLPFGRSYTDLMENVFAGLPIKLLEACIFTVPARSSATI